MKLHWPSATQWMVAIVFCLVLPSLAGAQERERNRRPPPREPSAAPASPPSASSPPPSSGRVAVPRGTTEGSATRSGGRNVGGSGDATQTGTARERQRSVAAGTAPATADTANADSRQPSRRYPAGNYSGVAVPRTSRPYPDVPGWNWSHPNYYRPSYWYWAPVGWGLGSWVYYDPWWWGSAWSWGGAGAPYASGYGYTYPEAGAVRLKVKPKNAQVFIDGYYVGIVDDFDGTFQKLRLDEGPHRLEVRLDGYLPLAFNIYVTLDRTITIKDELRPTP